MTGGAVLVVGLGKLGSCLAAVLAERRNVVGVDSDQRVVDAINRGEAPVDEPGLQALVTSHAGGSLWATTHMSAAVRTSDVAFVVVPTPSDDTGRFDNRHVIDAVSALAVELRRTTRPYTVAIVSTVMPGSCAGPIRETLDTLSGRRDVGLCYTPAFIALGSVIHDFTHPDVLLIGCDEPGRDFDACEPLIAACYTPATQMHRTSLVNAELAKLSLNVALSVKIAMANEVAQVCERAGGDAEQVLAAVGADSRIGSALLRPGPTAAGPCLPRDLAAFARLGLDFGIEPWMADGAHDAHLVEPWRILNRMLDLTENVAPAIVGVLGLAYKPGSHVMDASVGFSVATRAAATGLSVVAHDPKARGLWLNVQQLKTAAEVVDAAEVVLLATPWPEYKTLDTRGKPFFDLWGELPTLPNVHRFGRADG